MIECASGLAATVLLVVVTVHGLPFESSMPHKACAVIVLRLSRVLWWVPFGPLTDAETEGLTEVCMPCCCIYCILLKLLF